MCRRREMFHCKSRLMFPHVTWWRFHILVQTPRLTCSYVSRASGHNRRDTVTKRFISQIYRFVCAAPSFHFIWGWITTSAMSLITAWNIEKGKIFTFWAKSSSEALVSSNTPSRRRRVVWRVHHNVNTPAVKFNETNDKFSSVCCFRWEAPLIRLNSFFSC